jgi:hypothetical protein
MEDYDATSMEQLKSKRQVKGNNLDTDTLYHLYDLLGSVSTNFIFCFKLDYKNYYKGNPCSIIGSL